MKNNGGYGLLPVVMLLAATALSGCDSLQKYGIIDDRQKDISSERRSPAMNPGGGSQGSYYSTKQPPRQQYASRADFSNGFGNPSNPRSAPPVEVASRDFPAPPPAQQYAQAPQQASQYADIAPAAGYVPERAYPVQEAPVASKSLMPQQQAYAQPQYATAPMQQQALPTQQQAYAPAPMAPPQPQQYAAPQAQLPQQANQYANIAPAAGYVPQAPMAPSQPQQYAAISAQPQIQATPASVQQPPQQAYAQAQQPQAPQQPNNDASFWRDFYAYSQPKSPQNQGYPELAAIPPTPQGRSVDQYEQEIKALQQQASAPYQPQPQQQQAYQYQQPAPQPQYAVQPQYQPPQQQSSHDPLFDVPASVPAPQQMMATPPSQPAYGNYGYNQDPTLRAPQDNQQYPPSAIPLPPGSYVFSTSDGRKITLTPPARSSSETL